MGLTTTLPISPPCLSPSYFPKSCHSPTVSLVKRTNCWISLYWILTLFCSETCFNLCSFNLICIFFCNLSCHTLVRPSTYLHIYIYIVGQTYGSYHWGRNLSWYTPSSPMVHCELWYEYTGGDRKPSGQTEGRQNLQFLLREPKKVLDLHTNVFTEVHHTRKKQGVITLCHNSLNLWQQAILSYFKFLGIGSPTVWPG